MNFDQAKSLRLQQWRATLDDQDFRMQNPEAHRETLHQMAGALHTEGLIDQLEQFDMNEMADAAYWHSVEELQSSPGQYRGASTYDVVQVDTGRLLGNISRSIFNFESDEPRGASFSYDGSRLHVPVQRRSAAGDESKRRSGRADQGTDLRTPEGGGPYAQVCHDTFCCY
ncbi:hypothetical protein WCL09_09645 [Pseudomonas koreensis]|uniref:hypothetical protein n=1 Tax=Pseudomonas koreensis TaxID=198620 RepID=UPI003017D05C